MHMATTSHWWTAADLEGIPDDGCRYEALEGMLLVTPAAARTHNLVATRLAQILGAYCTQSALGEVIAPGVVRWRTNELQPDVMVSPPAPTDVSWDDAPLPLLVIEVHSPSTRDRDRGMKRLAYMQLGVPEYWQIDLEQRGIHIARPARDDVTVTGVLEWQPDPAIPPLTIDLAALFR